MRNLRILKIVMRNLLLILCRNLCRTRKIFLCSVAIFIFCVFYITTWHEKKVDKEKPIVIDKKIERFDLDSLAADNEKVACEIPKLDPYNPAILDLMEEDQTRDFNCTNIYSILFESFVDGSNPRLVPKLDNIKNFPNTIESCCYRNILKDNVKGNKKCFPVSLVNDTVIPPEHEFISIVCTSKTNKMFKHITVVDMHTFVHIKPEVRKRVDEWRRKRNKIKLVNSSNRLNVIVFGMDSMSRMHFLRTMPHTRDYLLNTLNAVEMQGFHKVGGNALANLGPLLTNIPASDEIRMSCSSNSNTSVDSCPFIWKNFAEFGYHTLFAEDITENFAGMTLGLSTSSQITDYYLPFFAETANKRIGHQQRALGNICYGPRSAFQIMVDYMKKMTVVLKDIKGRPENYFQFAWSSSITHDLLNGAKSIDKQLHSMLQWWHKGDYLENTVLVFMSVTGARNGKIYDLQQRMEERLPFLYIVVPPSFPAKYLKAYRNLIRNKRKLVTPWDVYQTLYHLLQPEQLNEKELEFMYETVTSSFSSTPGISLFLPVPASRTCKEAKIPINYCTCNFHSTQLATNDSLVQEAAEHVVQMLNSILAISTSHLCAYLFLERVVYAGLVKFGGPDASPSAYQKEYQLIIETAPGLAVYEALVVHQTKGESLMSEYTEWSIVGNIVRVDLQSNHSWCLEDDNKYWKAKMYCYCLPKRNSKSGLIEN